MRGARPSVRFVVVAGAFAEVLSLLVVSPASAATPLEEARSRANAAAQELARAQTSSANASQEVVEVTARRAATRAQVDQLQGALRDLAVERYLRGARGVADPVGASRADAAASRRADVLASAVVGDDVGALDRYRDALDDLARDEATVRDRQKQREAAVAGVRQKAAAAERELARLAALEASRIEAARKAAAAAAAAKPVPAPGAPSNPTPAKGATSNPTPAKGAPPRPQGRFVIDTDTWVCPVQGARAFGDDYGDARNGGRRHQGNDILSPRGTPVVAPVDGTVRRHDNGLGGISFYLNGSDGNQYYGAHLDAYSGVSGAIAQGTVIGYVGNTGDARGGPTHLHFEIHPGGGAPVNPYPTLRAHC